MRNVAGRLVLLMVIAVILMSSQVDATILQDWEFNNGTELSETSNSVPSGVVWSTDVDAFSHITNGVLVRDNPQNIMRGADANIPDRTNGIVFFVAENVNLTALSTAYDNFVLRIRQNDYVNYPCTLKVAYNGGNIEISGTGSGSDLGVVKTITGTTVSNLNVGVEWDLDDNTYRVLWKTGASSWASSSNGTVLATQTAQVLTFGLTGYADAGKSITFDRLYVSDVAIATNYSPIIEDWEFNDGTELSETSNSTPGGGGTDWSAGLDTYSHITNGVLVRDSPENLLRGADADISDRTNGILSFVAENVYLNELSTTDDKFVLRIRQNDYTVCCAVQVAYNAGNIEISGTGSGSDLGVVKTITGTTVSNLNVGVEWDLDDNTYRILWKTGASSWGISTNGVVSAGQKAEVLTLGLVGYAGGSKAMTFDRLYVTESVVPPPPQGTVVIIH